MQRFAWGGDGTNLLEAAESASAQHRLLTLIVAGVAVGIGQMILRQLTSANGIDTTAAIWFMLVACRLAHVRQRGAVDRRGCWAHRWDAKALRNRRAPSWPISQPAFDAFRTSSGSFLWLWIGSRNGGRLRRTAWRRLFSWK